MTLRKMFIKTGGTRGAEALRWCRERGIVAVGWSVAFDGPTPLPSDPVAHLAATYPNAVSPVRMLAGIQPSDLVWSGRGRPVPRTRVLKAFGDLVTALVGRTFTFESPFLW